MIENINLDEVAKEDLAKGVLRYKTKYKQLLKPFRDECYKNLDLTKENALLLEENVAMHGIVKGHLWPVAKPTRRKDLATYCHVHMVYTTTHGYVSFDVNDGDQFIGPAWVKHLVKNQRIIRGKKGEPSVYDVDGWFSDYNEAHYYMVYLVNGRTHGPMPDM